MAEAGQQLADVFFTSAAVAPQAIALRYFDKAHDDWRAITWSGYEQRVRKTAGWLMASGIGRGDRVAILSGNCPEWLIFDLAILAVGAISVPIYATSSKADITYILEHSEAKAIVCDDSTRLETIPTLPALRIFIDDSPSAHAHSVSFKKILASAAQPLAAAVACSPDDIASIIYTSGTTGLPKGVIHTHGNFIAVLDPVRQVLAEGRTSPDRFFSFLPLSHVAERVLVEIGSIASASEVVFARRVDTLIDDLAKFPPTILLCVPRLWERVHERVWDGLSSASAIKRKVFALAERAGACRLDGERIIKARDGRLGAKLADALVGRAFKRRLGMHRVRIFISGSAPTRPEILRFFGKFGVFIREVYGLTENLCLGTYTNPREIVIGSCGQPFPGNSIKLADDGEVLFRAPWLFKGYYKDEASSRASLSDDGWLATGDLGSLDASGLLRITGRKKELLKTSTGKYVAPVPVEDALKGLTLVADAIMIGDNEKFCIALVSLDEGKAKDQPIEELLREQMNKINANLASHESIKKIGILRGGFSIENGLLTPSMKLKRKAATELHHDFIRRVYTSSEIIIRE